MFFFPIDFALRMTHVPFTALSIQKLVRRETFQRSAPSSTCSSVKLRGQKEKIYAECLPFNTRRGDALNKPYIIRPPACPLVDLQ